jgi:thiol-disulfide isomerase/thioredoxin
MRARPSTTCSSDAIAGGGRRLAVLAAGIAALAVACSPRGGGAAPPPAGGSAAAVASAPAVAATPAVRPLTPASVAPPAREIDGSVAEAPPGTKAAPADTWKPVEAGEVLATVEMRLLRGLDGVEEQARTLQGAIANTPAEGVDLSELVGGTWWHGAVPVTNTEKVPFVVAADRSSLVLDSNRDGKLARSEELRQAEVWGGLAWFEGSVLVRQSVGPAPMQALAPVRVGVMLNAPRMACRIDGRREGVAQVGGRSVRLAIVDHTFRGWFSHPGIDAIVVDSNGDGRFDASADSSERYRLGEPFPIGDVDAVVTSVAPFGSRLTIARSKKPAARKESLAIGAAAPTFTATTVDGKPVDLARLKGKWVLLDFWATWCGPCRNGLPHLKELRKAHPELVIVGISGDDAAEAVTQFTKAQAMDWPQVHADARTIMRRYRVNSFPTSFLLAPDGTIAARDLRGPMVTAEVSRLKQQFGAKKG